MRTLTIPAPAPWVSANDRSHWATKARRTHHWRIAAGTPGGHRTHRARGEESCGPCTAAARAQNARDNQRKTEKRRYERAAS